MNKKLILNITLLLLLLLIGCSNPTQDDLQAPPSDVVTETPAESVNTTTQDTPQTGQQDVVTETPVEMDGTITEDDSQAFPPDVVAEIQAKMDGLTAGELPPGMVVWIDGPDCQQA